MNEIFISNKSIWEKSGVQIVVCAHNAEKFLARCLDSIENSCNKLDWTFIFADDGSTDNTINIIEEYSTKLSCTNCIIKKFPKAKNVAQAKNRALKLTKILAEDYPVICVVDSDDEMLAERIDYLLPEMIKQNSKFIIGDYILHSSNNKKQYVSADDSNIKRDLRFGIWATLFHESLISEDKGFFDEKMEVYSDFLKWWTLKYEDNLRFTFHSGKAVYNFYRRKSSVSGDTSNEQRLKIKEEKDRIHKLV